MLKLIDYEKSSGEYSARLAAFGDPVLDTLYERTKEKRERIVRERTPEPAKCPSCGEVRLLTRGYYALLCQDCHDGITELARKNRW